MANNFSLDPDCLAWFRFEHGALTADSKGANTLTAVNGPTEDQADYKEGACAAVLAKASLQYFKIPKPPCRRTGRSRAASRSSRGRSSGGSSSTPSAR